MGITSAIPLEKLDLDKLWKKKYQELISQLSNKEILNEELIKLNSSKEKLDLLNFKTISKYLYLNEKEKGKDQISQLEDRYSDKKLFELFKSKGLSYAISKKYEKSILQYSKAIKLGFDDSEIFQKRGLCFFHLKKYQDAIDDFTKAIKLGANDYEIWEDRGLCFFHLKKYQDAMDDFTKAIKLGAKDFGIWANRGSCFFNLEKYQNAIDDLTISITQNSKEPYLFYLRARSHNNISNFSCALEDIEKAINIKGSTKEYLEMKKTIQYNLKPWYKKQPWMFLWMLTKILENFHE